MPASITRSACPHHCREERARIIVGKGVPASIRRGVRTRINQMRSAFPHLTPEESGDAVQEVQGGGIAVQEVQGGGISLLACLPAAHPGYTCRHAARWSVYTAVH